MYSAGAARTQIPLTVAAFRRYLQQMLLTVTVICLLLMAFCALGIWTDIHALRRVRVEELSEFVEFKKGFFSRLDSFGWRMDTQAEITGATNKILADALVRMRAQVKESTDKSAQTAKATVTIAREATKQTAATTQAVQQLATDAKPVVNVEAARPAPPVVNVEAPRPLPVAHPATPQPAEQTHRGGRWWRHLWPWGSHGRTDD